MGVRRSSRASERVGAAPGPVFVFPPRNDDWQWSVVQRLHRDEPIFRDVLLECDREIQRQVKWSLDKLLGRDTERVARMFSDAQFEPTLTAVQIAQVECWRARGVEASAVAGYSGGEVAAAYTAGVLNIEEAMRVACTWSRVIEDGGVAPGGMILVNVSAKGATRLRAAMRQPIHIVVELAPKLTTFAGSHEAINALVSLLESRRVGYRRLPIPFTYHVPLPDSGKAAFLRRLSGLIGRRPAIPVYSTAAGGLLRDAQFDAHHWYGVISRPVLVADVTRRLLQDGHDRFLSTGLSPSAVFPIRQIALELGKEVAVSPSLNCLVENERPFLERRSTRTAAISRALRGVLRPVRRLGR